MIRSSRYQYGFSASRESLLGAWSGALLLHVVAVAALVFGWPQAREILDKIAPIEIRLLTPEKPPEPLPPPPPPPARKPPPPSAPQPLPVAAAPTVEAPPTPVVVAVASSAPTTFFLPPAPLEKPAPPAEPLAVSMPAAPAPEPLIEARFDADYLSNPKLVYPNASRRLGEEGVVHLRVRVSAEGTAERVELKKSSGFTRLDQAARETVARWQFVPARRGRTAVAAWVVVPIIFSLN